MVIIDFDVLSRILFIVAVNVLSLTNCSRSSQKRSKSWFLVYILCGFLINKESTSYSSAVNSKGASKKQIIPLSKSRAHSLYLIVLPVRMGKVRKVASILALKIPQLNGLVR